jgi:hypothetical protein
MFIYACLFTRKFTHVHLRMSSSRTPFTLAHAAKVTLSPNLFSHVTYSFTHVSLRMFIYACLTHARPFTHVHLRMSDLRMFIYARTSIHACSFLHVHLRMFIYACLTHARPFTLAHAAQVTLSPNLSIQQLTADQCAQQS